MSNGLRREVLKDAFKLAVKKLRSCYTEHGILAGRHQFSDYWARDSFFASFGACKLLDFEIVRKNLKLFLSHQAEDGQIPLRVGTYNIIKKMLTRKEESEPKELRPRYTIDTIFPNNLKATDCNSLFVIAVTNYARESKDMDFIKKNFQKIEKAMQWNFTQDKDDDLILEDQGFTAWDDRILKKGEVLYTNVLHFKALDDFTFILKKLNQKKESLEYEKKAKHVKNMINKLFWNGEYFIDWIDEKGKKQDYFSTSGNAVAALWLADKKQIKKIQKTISKFNLDNGFALKTVYPEYPSSLSHFPTRILGFGDYHSKMLWPWITCFYAVALAKVDKKQAKEFIEKLSEKSLDCKDFYEVYEQDGRPVNRIFYKSEHPFAWFAGAFILAYD